jgi:hypothetical protein
MFLYSTKPDPIDAKLTCKLFVLGTGLMNQKLALLQTSDVEL